MSVFLSDILDLEFSLYRPSPDRKHEGTLSSNFAGVDGKEVIIVDDVVGSGDTLRSVIRDVKTAGGIPVLCCVFVNKTGFDDIGGVPVRGFIRAINIA